MSSRLGIDVGGTFTDLLLFDERSGGMRLFKTPSTPSDQSIGILNGIQQLFEESGVAASEVTALLHGTTVSTNIVLEEKGAKVGLLVTENFEQVLHLARSQTPGPLAGWIIMQKPDPLADLELTRGIRERISPRGEVITPLDEASTRLKPNLRRVLLLPPDLTRAHSGAGWITETIYNLLPKSCDVHIIPTLGQHVPHTEAENKWMFGSIPHERIHAHDWRGGAGPECDFRG